MNKKIAIFECLKDKLIKMGFLYHTPKSLLNVQDRNDVKKYGLIHFTFSENIEKILENGVIPGKDYLYRKEKNLCWFYINYPETYSQNLKVIKSKGQRSNVDCYIIIKGFSEKQLNNMRIRKENDNAVVHIGVLKTNNMEDVEI